MKSSRTYTRAIYAIANKLGLCDRSAPKEDELHGIVYQITGKSSVSKLTTVEAERVLRKLDELNPDKKITTAQHAKAWALFYHLKELSPGTASDGERMAGIVKKATGKNVRFVKPLQYLRSSEAEKVIEMIKRYIRTLEKRKE